MYESQVTAVHSKSHRHHVVALLSIRIIIPRGKCTASTSRTADASDPEVEESECQHEQSDDLCSSEPMI